MCVCVSSPTAGFRVTIQHYPPSTLTPFPLRLVWLVSSHLPPASPPPSSAPPSPHLSSASSLHMGVACGWGGWGVYAGDDSAKNQPQPPLMHAVMQMMRNRMQIAYVCISQTHRHRHRGVIRYYKEGHIRYPRGLFLWSRKIMFKWAALIWKHTVRNLKLEKATYLLIWVVQKLPACTVWLLGSSFHLYDRK